MNDPVRELAERLAGGMEKRFGWRRSIDVRPDHRAARARPRVIEGVPGTGKTLAVRALRCCSAGVPAHRFHARPDAFRRRRHDRLQPADRAVQHAHRADRGQRRARRRSESHAAQDAVGAAGGDGRRTRHDRRHSVSVAAAVLALRDAKPDRIRGNVSASRGAAGPLHAQSRVVVPAGVAGA